MKFFRKLVLFIFDLIDSFMTMESSKMDNAARKTFGLYRSVSDIHGLATGTKNKKLC